MLSSINFIKKNKSKRVIGKIASKEINKAETELSIKFGEHLKSIISEFGCILFNHIEIFGLGVKKTSHLNIVSITKELRKYNLPPGYIPFFNMGDGHYALVDDNDKVYEFVINEKKVSKLANSINDYLLELFKKNI
jgi:hypothetical protein